MFSTSEAILFRAGATIRQAFGLKRAQARAREGVERGSLECGIVSDSTSPISSGIVKVICSTGRRNRIRKSILWPGTKSLTVYAGGSVRMKDCGWNQVRLRIVGVAAVVD